MAEIELELSYLAASLPPDLVRFKHLVLRDIYLPAGATHPKLRVRQKGDKYELTKKTQLSKDDASAQSEENISLTQAEFDALAKGDGRELSKTRYFMPYTDGVIAEVDVFNGPLKGLVIIEFEFKTLAGKQEFTRPYYCLADVTQEDFIAGGVLAGKSYGDIRVDLERFGYAPL